MQSLTLKIIRSCFNILGSFGKLKEIVVTLSDILAKKIIYMHRQIMNAPAGVFIDHRYGNGLDNRKENLRIATIAQNQYNRRKLSKKTSSKYKGVHLKRNMKKYCAVIGCNGKRIFLGCFENEIDAAKAYDKAAMLYHKEFAVLNFPNDPQIKTVA